MKKIIILRVLLILLIIIFSIIAVISIVNRKNDWENVAVINEVESFGPLAEEFNEKEIDVTVSEPEETPEVISIPKLTKGIYYIKVNNQMNTVTVYVQDKNGDYTIPVKAMICSTGNDTPKNCTYKISGKKWPWRLLFGNVYGQYTTHINQNILFHSVPYEKERQDTLEYWEYDKLGTTCSLGCIRLTVEDAKWIYDNCLQGSIVEFYDSEDPGPLGKPEITPISEYTEYRNWDPTDPDANNPWTSINEP